MPDTFHRGGTEAAACGCSQIQTDQQWCLVATTDPKRWRPCEELLVPEKRLVVDHQYS